MFFKKTKYVHVLHIVINTKRYSRNFTYFNTDKSSLAKKGDELNTKFAGRVSSRPDDRTYKHFFYSIAL